MTWGKIVLGILIIVLSVFLARFGEMDDAPGAVLIALILCIFGIYLVVRSVMSRKKVKSRRK